MSEDKTHYARTEACAQTYRVFYGDELILESNQAIEMKEYYQGKEFSPVVYFPESAISSLQTLSSNHMTHCPIKGDAAYLNFRDASNGIWFYPQPLRSVGQIKNHYAFDQNQGFRVVPAC